ncbi:MAG: alpha/beta fold hydrolase [Pseudomonadota bacterium]
MPGETGSSTGPRPVILLHGLGRTAASMWWLSRLLDVAGMKAHPVNYPSTRQSLGDNAATVLEQIQHQFSNQQIDLVGHSMGGVISRRLCLDDNGLNVRRVVQLGAPNLGSALADRMGPFWAVRKACGPAIEDLRATTRAVAPNPRIHAIAGTGGCRLINGALKGPHDGAVTVRSAWAGAGCRYRSGAIHTLMPQSNEVARHVIHALSREDGPTAP